MAARPRQLSLLCRTEGSSTWPTHASERPRRWYCRTTHIGSQFAFAALVKPMKRRVAPPPFMPSVQHFLKRPLASRHGVDLAAALPAGVAGLSTTATADFFTALATGAGHLMNLPFASLHCTGFVAAAFGAAGFVAALAVVASARAAAADSIVRII